MADNDEYHSSDDEDYVPEGENEEVEDEPSGDEVDEVTAEEGTIVSGSRRLKKKSHDSTKKELEKKEETTLDADAILAMLEEEDPLLASCRQATQNKSNPIATGTDIPHISSSVQPSTSSGLGQKTKIKEVFDFAGEEITIEKEVTAEELKEHEEKAKKTDEGKKPQKRLGLTGALTMLSKKPKISVLDKSNHDWNVYKDEHKLHEEIATHNKGKNGYLSKVDFLTRTDFREFENEKAMRQSSKK